MGFLQSTWEVIKSVGQSILKSIFGRRMDWQERFNELGFSTTPSYTPEEPDIQLRNKCVEYINQKFPHGFEYFYLNSTVDERVEMLKSMTEDLSDIYGVKLNDIVLYTPDNEFKQRTAGYYSTDENTLNLNVSLLFQENMTMSAEAFLTIFHELKHARQWFAIKGEQDYGYSPELLYSWAINWKNENYITFMESDEGYRNQPIEFDAFAFEEQFRYIFQQ